MITGNWSDSSSDSDTITVNWTQVTPAIEYKRHRQLSLTSRLLTSENVLVQHVVLFKL